MGFGNALILYCFSYFLSKTKIFTSKQVKGIFWREIIKFTSVLRWDYNTGKYLDICAAAWIITRQTDTVTLWVGEENLTSPAEATPLPQSHLLAIQRAVFLFCFVLFWSEFLKENDCGEGTDALGRRKRSQHSCYWHYYYYYYYPPLLQDIIQIWITTRWRCHNKAQIKPLRASYSKFPKEYIFSMYLCLLIKSKMTVA